MAAVVYATASDEILMAVAYTTAAKNHREKKPFRLLTCKQTSAGCGPFSGKKNKKNLRGPEPPLPRARILGGAVKNKMEKKKERGKKEGRVRSHVKFHLPRIFLSERERERER